MLLSVASERFMTLGASARSVHQEQAGGDEDQVLLTRSSSSRSWFQLHEFVKAQKSGSKGVILDLDYVHLSNIQPTTGIKVWASMSSSKALFFDRDKTELLIKKVRPEGSDFYDQVCNKLVWLKQAHGPYYLSCYRDVYFKQSKMI